jgi:hypothetical protein
MKELEGAHRNHLISRATFLERKKKQKENRGRDPKRDSHEGKLLADAAGWNSDPSTHRE